MAAILTKLFRSHIAEKFSASFSGTDAAIVYMFVGHPNAWIDDNVPPTPADSVQDEFMAWRDMMWLKRIPAGSISYMIPRYRWANNTVYTKYSDTNANLATSMFYVQTANDHVYKCIENNRGGASIVKPSGTGTPIVSTGDGYRWKYMYTISAADALKFETADFIPVKYLSANDGSNQWLVQSSAANGAIHHVAVGANGTGYISTSNTVSSVVNSTAFVLKTNALATDGAYVHSTVYITSGLGSGQLRRAVKYVGATRTLTVNNAFAVVPDVTSTYMIAPNVLIKGDGVTQATAYVNSVVAGQIKAVTMINVGSNYSIANAVFIANSSYGSAATATPVISPPLGHGANPVKELFAYNVMLNAIVLGSEGNTLPTNTAFRTIGIVKDPKLSNGSAANASVITSMTALAVTGATGDFTAGEVVVGGTSSARGRLAWFANTNAAHTAGTVYLAHLSMAGTGKNFVAAEVITGSMSGKTATITSKTNPAIRHFSGDVLYIENRTPVNRDAVQQEDFKTLLRF